MKRIIILASISLFAAASVWAQVPQTLNYQGRVAVGTTNFTGTGLFKFALVNGDGTVTFWSNDGSSVAGSQPAAAVSLPVNAGLYSLQLGDATLVNMGVIPPSVFDASDVRLRVWFNDGVNGFEQFTTDYKFSSVPFALRAHAADSVADAAITADKIAPGAITASKIAPASVDVSRLSFNGTPNIGQVLAYDGANLTWMTPSGGGGGGGGSLTLPYSSGPVANNGALFSISNTGITDAWGIYGHSQTNLGVFGQTHGNAQSGVLGRNDGATGINGAGVFGYASTQAAGVLAISELGYGVLAEAKGPDSSSIFAQTLQASSVAGRFHHNGSGTAVIAEAGTGWAVFGRSQSGLGVFGQSITGGSGVLGRNESNTGHAVHGYAIAGATGVRGDSATGDGVIGASAGSARSGVAGFSSSANGYGMLAFNSFGTGIFAKSEAATGAGGFFWNSAGGDAIRALGNVNVDGTTTTKVLTITGGADIAEPFQMGGGEIAKGSVVVIDENNPGHLRQSAVAYDTRVAGIVSGANGVQPGIALHQQGVLEGGQHVALSGRVYVLADATGGAIRPGDLLTSSALPGHAMKVTDHSRAQGAVLGKAMTRLDSGTGYVLVLVTLQ